MYKIIQFFGSFQFLKGLVISISAMTALLTGYYHYGPDLGLAAAFGVILVALSDITGVRTQRIGGMIAALLLGMINFVVVHWARSHGLLLYAIFTPLVFFSAYISIYGFRASLVSLSALLGISIGFARDQGMDNMEFSTFMIVGGFWYMGISLLTDLLTPRIYRRELMAQTLTTTADLLEKNAGELTGKPPKGNADNSPGLEETLIELHQQLRTELFTRERLKGMFGEQRNQVLILAELVDLFELIIARQSEGNSKGFKEGTPLAISKMIGDHLLNSAGHLRYLAQGKPAPDALTVRGTALREGIENAIDEFRSQGLTAQKADEILRLRNLSDYARQVEEKVNNARQFLYTDLPVQKENYTRHRRRFLSEEPLKPLLLKEHFSLRSPLMRHALRLTGAMLVGLFIGEVFNLPRAYWILLTIIVIMRPSYALTKQRSRQRTIGTLIGAGIAAVIFLSNPGIPLQLGLIFIALIFSFAFLQQNFAVSVVFVTIAIVMIYGLITIDAMEVIGYRIVDTLIGAGLAVITNLVFLPNWEIHGVRTALVGYLQAQHRYLQAIEDIYREKQPAGVQYRLGRKDAFLAYSQLYAAFQRHLQEPARKQKNLPALQDTISAAQKLLTASATMGTYIQIHQTTAPSVHFITYMSAVQNTLRQGSELLGESSLTEKELPETVEEARQALQAYASHLISSFEEKVDRGETEFSEDFRETLKESRVLIEQLDWTHQLSQRLMECLRGV